MQVSHDHMSLSFSIVINTYDRAHTLRNSLESLRFLRHKNFEVIVVNGPSMDGTEAILAEYSQEIRIGRCPEANLSKSRNIGIAMSCGDVICFMDDDAVPEPDWLNQLEVGYTNPRIAAVGGFIRDHTGVSYQSKVVVCDRYADAYFFDSIADANVTDGPFPSKYLTLTGTNSSFLRDILVEIGGFDEEYAYFLDETDVIVRLVDAGYLVRYVPNAEIHHKFAESHLRTTTKIPKSIYLPVRSKTYFCLKNAAPGASLDKIFAYVRSYQSSLKRDKKWLFDHKKIDEAHYNRLLEEIDRGVKDGVHDAFALTRRNLLCPDMIMRHTAPFKRFSNQLEQSSRLRICFLSQDYPPCQCGGIGVWTNHLATALAREGHEVTVITRSGHEHPTVDFEEGVWVHRIVPLHQPRRTAPMLPDIPQTIKDYTYTAYDEVMRVHVRRGLDVVSSPIWDLEGAACISANAIPTVLSLHSTYKFVLPSKPDWISNPEYKAGHVDKMIVGEKWAIEHADLILANSKAVIKDIEREYVLKIDAARLSLVPHGIKDVFEVGDHQSIYGQDGKCLRLLFVGRFEDRKGIDIVLAALPNLLERYQNLEAHLVGDNGILNGGVNYRDQFIEKYGQEPWFKRIYFAGIVSNFELMAQYKLCDVFVAPSRYESFGLIFLEAMMFGKPCIGTNVGGIPEVVIDRNNGLLVPVNDAEALASAITMMIEDDDMRCRLGINARQTFLQYFTDTAMVEKFISTMRTFLHNRKITASCENIEIL